jgi:hypothetical protein
MTNTLAYCGTELVTDVKSFMKHTLEIWSQSYKTLFIKFTHTFCKLDRFINVQYFPQWNETF